MMIDFSNPLHYMLALLPETVLSAWAMLLLLVDVFQKGDESRPSSPMIGWLSLVGIVLAGIANAWLPSLETTTQTGMIAIDQFRVFSNYLFLLAGALFFLTSGRYLEREGLHIGEVHVLVLFAVVGMMVFGAANDLMVAFIGLEMMSLPVYVLTGANRRDRRSAEGALKYFLLGAFSSAFFLLGVALVYGATQTTVLPLIASAAAGQSDNLLLIGGIGMLAVGFGFKVAAVPFHMWTPDAYEGAPAPITAFMAAGIKAAAFAAFMRVFLTAFPSLVETWGHMIAWVAILTMVVANLVALVQGNVKRMLAYSSVAHAGYLLVALASGSTTGAASFLFYLVVYTLMTVGAFAVVFIIGQEGESRLDLDAYSGLAWRRPLLGVVMTIFLLSLAGFPFTGGFIGKVFILQSAVANNLVALAVVLVLTSLVSYWYYLRMAWYMWFREPQAEGAQVEVPVLSGTMRAALLVSALLIIALGVLPGELLDAAERSAASLSVNAASLGLGR